MSTHFHNHTSPIQAFPRPDAWAIDAECRALFRDVLRAHEHDPWDRFLLLLRSLTVEDILDILLEYCTTEQQRITVMNNMIRLWHAARMNVPTDSAFARSNAEPELPQSIEPGGQRVNDVCVRDVSEMMLPTNLMHRQVTPRVWPTSSRRPNCTLPDARHTKTPLLHGPGHTADLSIMCGSNVTAFYTAHFSAPVCNCACGINSQPINAFLR